MNIVLTHIKSYKAICIAKYLKTNYKGIKIFGLMERNKKYTIYSKYFDGIIEYNKCDIASNRFTATLNEKDILLVIPIKNSEMEFWLQNKEELTPLLDYWGGYQSFLLLNNKLKLCELASSLNISVPKVYRSPSELSLDFVIKPINLSSAKGIKYITTEDELNLVRQSFADYSDKILQKYIKGYGIGYSCFCKNGEIVIGYGHKRLAEYPITGGSSVYRTSFVDDRMVNISQQLVKAVNWSGFAMFEFKLTPNNEIYLIEVNPRIWGSINQGLQNGTNYFEPLLGKSTVAKKNPKKEINTYLSPLTYLSFIKYLINFNFKPLITFLNNIFRNRADVSLFDDPKGWFSMVLNRISN